MAQMSKSGYTYERALNANKPEIRILSILPGSQSSAIECTLEITCLADEPAYSCISYTWGDPRPVSAIRLNGRSFTVAKSVSIAMRYLRHETETVRIWIDAVCINQGDNREKASQVRQMAEIYMKSNKVIIWLGEEADDSSHAMKAIHGIDRRWASRTSRLRQKCVAAARGFDEATQAIAALLQRPWWLRAWIVQEATCANDTYVKCGRDMTDFAAFVATANCLGYHVLQRSLQRHGAPDIQHLQRVFALDRLKRERGRANYRSDMLGLLDQFRTCEASDPRDKIFAFAALATGTQKTAVRLDYSVPVDVAYRSFAYAFIGAERNLHILGHCQDHVQTLGSWSSFRPPICRDIMPRSPLPSWTPDWTVMQETTSFAKHEDPDDGQSKRLYKATCSFVPVVRLSENVNIMIVRGCTFDRVLHLGPEFTSPLIPATMRSWHDWAVAHCGDTNLSYASLHDAFLRTIVADVAHLEGRCVRGFSAEWPVPNEPDDTEESFGLHSAIRMAVHSRRLCISEKGFLGLVRFDARRGDEICLLHGGHVPFILRQVGDTYRFKGECFVHGLMDGEGMRYPRIWRDFALG